MERTQKLVNDVPQWLQCNRLYPNTSKTFLMLFTTRKINVFLSIYYNNDVLQWKDNLKYLGITLDNRLNFNLQINYIKSKICGDKTLFIVLVIILIETYCLVFIFT